MRPTVVMLVLALVATAHAQSPPTPGFYGDVQFLWFDSPIQSLYGVQDEGVFNEFAPRFILGYNDTVGARVRWWTYDRSTMLYDADSGGPLKMSLSFDVVDLEATTHLRYASSDFLFSGGARIAVVEQTQHWINQDIGGFEETTMGGLTFAGEGRTNICASECWGISAVYGGRLSLLEADWNGDYWTFHSPTWPPIHIQNERFIVPEVFAGVEAHYGRAF